jgi:excisionase family DNA binding protein
MSISFQAQEAREQERRRAYSVRETARTTNLSYATIYRLIGKGRLKTVKVGGRRLVPVEAIDALLAGGAP